MDNYFGASETKEKPNVATDDDSYIVEDEKRKGTTNSNVQLISYDD